MFKVAKIVRGDCDGNDSHTDKDVLLMEDLVTHQALKLCQKCFIAQIKLRSKGQKAEENGHPEGWKAV